MSSVIGWLTRPCPDRAVRTADDADGWSTHSYPDLAHAARCLATELAARGVRRNDVVCLVLPSEIDLVIAIYASWAAGATIAPIAPPTFDLPERYVAHLAGIVRQADPRMIVTTADHEQVVRRAVAEAAVQATVWVAEHGTTAMAPAEPGDIALLQFTSGSTGTPRGVRISWPNLDANLAAIARYCDGEPGDAVATWLPLHHDMGLIGGLLYPIAHQDDVWLMRPDQFIRNPARWLECFGPGRARHTAAPPFGLAYAARKVTPEQFAALDLAGLRSIIVGAEAVDPQVLNVFAAAAAAGGFRPEAFMPAYGMAEHTLAVTIAPRDRPVRLARIDWSTLRFGEPVTVKETACLGEAASAACDGWMVAHPLPSEEIGIWLRIVTTDGSTAPAGTLGEIAVRGTSTSEGYHREFDSSSTVFRDGELFTGDAGFVHDGHLYVLGRMGDSIKLNGRSVYAEDLDIKLAAATGLSRGRLVVVATTEQTRPRVTVFAAADPGPWVQAAYECLRVNLGPIPDITVVAGDSGIVQRTSSGKPRRQHMWRLFRAGELGGTVLDPANY